MENRITSVQNLLVKHLCRLVQQRKYREEQNSCIVEGVRTLSELDPTLLRTLLVTEKMSREPLPFCKKTFFVSEEVMRKITATKNPEGVLAEVSLPEQSDLSFCTKLVVLDGLQDPGNVGTIFRTALAFGWEGIVLLEGSCDPFNDKALRAAKGATFKLPHIHMSRSLFLKWCEEQNISLFAAHLQGKPLEEVTIFGKKALLFGSEGQGVCEELLAKAETITIPMTGAVESLNVAVSAGILLYSLTKEAS